MKESGSAPYGCVTIAVLTVGTIAIAIIAFLALMVAMEAKGGMEALQKWGLFAFFLFLGWALLKRNLSQPPPLWVASCVIAGIGGLYLFVARDSFTSEGVSPIILKYFRGRGAWLRELLITIDRTIGFEAVVLVLALFGGWLIWIAVSLLRKK